MSLPLAVQVTSILPTDFVMGIDRQFFDFETPSMSYLRGEWRDHGWYHYYVYAMLIKMPIGFWLLLLIAFVGAVRSFGSPSLPIIAMLVTPAAILFLVSRETGFNCHLRYVLPAFPFLLH